MRRVSKQSLDVEFLWKEVVVVRDWSREEVFKVIEDLVVSCQDGDHLGVFPDNEVGIVVYTMVL